MTAKNAKLALTEAILELRKHEHDPNAGDPKYGRTTAEEGYTPAQGELSFVQKDDPEAGYIAAYCPKCTVLIKKGPASEVAPYQGQLCDGCKQISQWAVQNTVSPPTHTPPSVCVMCHKKPSVIQICSNLFNQSGFCCECFHAWWWS